MKRGMWMLCALACSSHPTASPAPPPVSDAAIARHIALGIGGVTHHFFVVRGESVEIPFVLGGSDAAQAGAVGCVGLPSGLTSTPTPVNAETKRGFVTITASPDAFGDANYVLTTTVPAAGSVATFELTVVGVDGSLDPTFGDGGALQLPSSVDTGSVVAMAASGEKMIVVANVYTAPTRRVWIARLLTSGAFDSTFGTAGVTAYASSNGIDPTYASDASLCADGTLVALTRSDVQTADAGLVTDWAVAYFDAGGIFAAAVPLPNDVQYQKVACADADAVVVTGYKSLVVIDAAHTLHVSPLASVPVTNILTDSPAIYLASSDLVRMLPDGQGGYQIDTSFGGDGGVPVGGDVTLDFAKRFVITGDAVSTLSVSRLAPTGALDTTFADGGVATCTFDFVLGGGPTRIGSTSNDIFALTSFPQWVGYGVARVSASGSLVPTFGNQGITTIATSEVDTVQAAAFDTSGSLWIAVSPLASTAYLARFRIIAP